QERMVVDRFTGDRIVTVALRLERERADHLRMAVVATLAYVYVASGQLETGRRFQARHRRDRLRLVHQRNNLGEAAEADRDRDQDREKADVLFDHGVVHDVPSGGNGDWNGDGFGEPRPAPAIPR